MGDIIDVSFIERLQAETAAAARRADQAEAERREAVARMENYAIEAGRATGLLRAKREELDAAEALTGELAAALRDVEWLPCPHKYAHLTEPCCGGEVCFQCSGHRPAHGDGCTIAHVLARTPAAAAERVAAMEAALRQIAATVELPEVTEESTDCPGCGSSVDWRGDYAPDIGDCIACDECKSARLDEAGMIARAALARLDAAGGDR